MRPPFVVRQNKKVLVEELDDRHRESYFQGNQAGAKNQPPTTRRMTSAFI